MAVVVWITDVKLTRQANRHNYKVVLPKSAGAINSDLREKIIDAMVYKYEQRSRFHQGGYGSEQPYSVTNIVRIYALKQQLIKSEATIRRKAAR